MATRERITRTPKAWEVLSRPDLIGRRAHTLLLMANGRRSEHELAGLLGEDIRDMADGLSDQGYLQTLILTIPAEDE
ncbi:MAG: hypothetical protein ACKOXQ_00280 [Hydrogenophaga sp.]